MTRPERVTPTELAAIRDRHPNIPQPTLEDTDDEPQTQDEDTGSAR